MKIPKSSRLYTDNDSLSSNFNESDNIEESQNNNKTEQIRLRRNLLQSKYPMKNNENVAQENKNSYHIYSRKWGK